MEFSPDGARLATGSFDKSIRLWDVETRTLVRAITGDNMITSLAFTPDGKRIAGGGWENAIQIWEVESGELVHRLEKQTKTIERITFGPEGKLLASTSWDRTMN